MLIACGPHTSRMQVSSLSRCPLFFLKKKKLLTQALRGSPDNGMAISQVRPHAHAHQKQNGLKFFILARDHFKIYIYTCLTLIKIEVCLTFKQR